MSLFDTPRINFNGTIVLNPGTANNDDYSGMFFDPKTGDNLALLDSARVQANEMGQSPDDQFISWIQKVQTFASKSDPSKTSQIIPAEWNYYGDMSATVSASVVGVDAPADNADYDKLQALIGKPVSWSGNITDVNPEGSPPSTQFFVSELVAGGMGIPEYVSKGACVWINFVRNVNLTADDGSGGYLYHVIPGGHTYLPGFDAPHITGLILRYYLYAKHDYDATNSGITSKYENQQTNDATFYLTGTIAPLFEGETNTTQPVGRLLSQYTNNLETPSGLSNNGGGHVSLAPAVLVQRGGTVSVDFLGSFPEQCDRDKSVSWTDQTKKNPKYNFGIATLEVTDGTTSVPIAQVDYIDITKGNAKGWIFDYDLPTDPDAQKVWSNPDATYLLRSEKLDAPVLSEEDYYFVTNQISVYGEEGQTHIDYTNQGLPKQQITVDVYHRGVLLTPDSCPPIKVWRYASTPLLPLDDVEPAELIQDDLRPGEAVNPQTNDPGAHFLTYTIAGSPHDPPPANYNLYIDVAPNSPPDTLFSTLRNRPSNTVRILPNFDFSQYWDVVDGVKVGNDALTFEVLFENVLRTYYVLFPAMNAVCPLNNPDRLAGIAQQILTRTDPNIWLSSGYMPITRDMSESRRDLLHAWCRKVLKGGSPS